MRLIEKLLLLVLAGSTTQPFAQTPSSAHPAFEVTTVKLNTSGNSSSGSDFANGRFTAHNVSLKNVMQYQAYGIPEPRIVGGPSWLNTQRFDIQAKTDDAAADALRALDADERRRQKQRMFQQLLADRFKLAAHWETRELPVYALVVAKGGPTLQPTKQQGGETRVSVSNDQVTLQGVTMTEIARTITQEMSRELGRVVIDRTGINGKFDLTLHWTPETGTTPVATNASPPPDSAPSIFTAIQEQLGLRLESTKGPVEVLVIDHVEMPSEN